MELNDDLLEQLAKKAALLLTNSEKKQLGKELSQITYWVEKLGSLDLSDIEPQVTMSVETNVFATDVADQALPLEKVFLNAPQHDGTYFHVPSVSKKKE